MFDIKELKHKIQNGGIALSDALEQRILNDQMTEADHTFVSKAFGIMRDVQKNGVDSFLDIRTMTVEQMKDKFPKPDWMTDEMLEELYHEYNK